MAALIFSFSLSFIIGLFWVEGIDKNPPNDTDIFP